MLRYTSRLLFLIALVLSTHANAATSILPDKFVLNGPTSRQQLVLENFRDKLPSGQITNGVAFVSSDPEIVKIVGDVALPLKNGTATIRAKAGANSASTRVTVTGMERPVEWSFRNNVQPVLAKFGCSAGACHGAAAGQNGFKLSLRGYDDEGDYLALTRNALGRRIIPSDPGQSLFLLKPTGAVPHKGGKKFDTNSLEYRVLSEWIANGSPGPKKDEPRIEHIEVSPAHAILQPGEAQQMLVRAVFNDGHAEDVTRWVKYTDSNSSVTQVDESGKVKVLGYGEGAITAWYLSRIAIATVTVPFSNNIPSRVFAKAARRNFIDDLGLEKLKALKLPPSERCTDEEFIRRAFIDSTGVLPTAEETIAFIADKASKKRDVLIEKLLNRTEFVDYWSYKWSDLFLVNSAKLKPQAMWSYYNWIRRNVENNTAWDVMARRVMTAEGSTLENGAANFYVLHEDPRNISETASLAFLGMSINCAKCHNHPLEKWTNNDYYGMANLFARVRSKNGPGDGNEIVFVSTQGDLVQPLTGKPQLPRPLDGKPLTADSMEDRRESFAQWLTSPQNPYFTRSIVNRVWANFMGVGLVESVDDMRATNPSSNEVLLSAMAKYLSQQKYDLKALMRLIMQSETYQRSSKPAPGNEADTRFYSRYYPRRMMAEVMLDAFSEVTGAPTEFKSYPKGWRAIQLPDSNVASYFLTSFGRPERDVTCTCERNSEPSVTQVLHIANGDTINKKLSAKDNRIGQLLMEKATPEKIVDDAYLSALSRHPTEAEQKKVLEIINATEEKDRRAVIEDMYWALLSSKEFLFNH